MGKPTAEQSGAMVVEVGTVVVGVTVISVVDGDEPPTVVSG
jgi:hypothetical protein